MIAVLFMILVMRDMSIYTEFKDIDSSELKRSVCESGMRSILDNELNPNLLEKEIVKILKKDPFTLNKYKILYTETKKDGCDLYLKEKTLRRFKLQFTEKSTNPFKFKIDSVDEVEV